MLDALRSRAPGQWSSNVLELARHFTSAIYLAVNTKSNQLAACSRKIFEMDPDEPDAKTQLSYRDPAVQIFEKPNTDDSGSDIMYQVNLQLDLTGFALVWKPLDGLVPHEQYVIPTATVFPLPQSQGYENGAYRVLPLYPYGPFTTLPSYQSAAGAIIPAEQIIRIKNSSPMLRYDGYSMLTALSLQIDTIDGIDTARKNTQARGIDPSLVMNFDPKFYNTKDEGLLRRLRAQLEAIYAGPENVGKILFNPYGTSTSVLSGKPTDMAWQDGWSQLVDFVMAACGVPKSVAGMESVTSFSTLFAQLKQFFLFSLKPTIQKAAGKFNRFLLHEHFGDDLFLEMEPEKITDEDMLEKQLTADGNLGIRTLNEFRKLRGLPLWTPELSAKAKMGNEGDMLWSSKGPVQLMNDAAKDKGPGGVPSAGVLDDLLGGGKKQNPNGGGGAGGDGSGGDRPEGMPDKNPQESESSRPRPVGSIGALGPRKSIIAAMDRYGSFLSREARDLWEDANKNGHAMAGTDD